MLSVSAIYYIYNSIQVGGLSLPRQAMDYVREAHSSLNNVFLFLLSIAGQIGRDANSSRPVTSTVGALSAVARERSLVALRGVVSSRQ